MTRRIALVLAALALLAAGCGDDNEGSKPQATPVSNAQDTNSSTPSASETGGDEGEAAKEALFSWMFEGNCDAMTDNFLEEQAFIGDSREERCAYIEKTFQKPQYTEDDVKIRSLKVTGDKADIVVGDDISNVETTYHLLKTGEQWQVDGTD